MWYFTWILGIGLALAFGIINVMWLEASYTFGELDEDRIHDRFAGKDDSVSRLAGKDDSSSPLTGKDRTESS